MWSEKELVNDYTFLKMPINYFFVFVEKLIWNVVGWSEKFECLKIKYQVKQRVGNGRAGADRENIWREVGK
jgi:hypothetical protein